MPEISKRAASLGTENAFVVLAEVNALARQGLISLGHRLVMIPNLEHVSDAMNTAKLAARSATTGPAL